MLLPLLLSVLVVGCNGRTDAETGTDRETDTDADTDTDTDVPDTDADDDGVAADEDCDDDDPAIGLPGPLFPDTDLDGYGDIYVPAVQSCPAPGLTADGTDCDDTNGAVHPGAPEIWCDFADQDCDQRDNLDDARWNGILYPVAQDALDAAPDDAVVEICDPRGRLIVDHPVQMTAAWPGAYVVDGITITAESGTVSITGLAFSGNGDGFVDVDGLDAGAGISAIGKSDVIIDGATFDACWADKGAAIFATTNKTVTIRNSRFTDSAGGAVLATSDLVVEDSTFEFNVADGREGGAIWSSGDLTLTRVTFDRNTATLGGGALYQSGPTATLTDVDFLTNSTDGNGGGAVFAGGVNSLTDVVFTANRAEGNGGAAVLSGMSHILADVDVDGNTAVGNGGGIWSSAGTTTVSGGLFTANTAVDGGAIALDGEGTWIGGTSDANTASGYGGGISAVGTWTIADFDSVGDDGATGDAVGISAGSTVTMADSELHGMAGGRVLYVHDSLLSGAGVVVTGPASAGIYLTVNADAQLEDCTIDAVDGDGLYIISDATATVTNSVFSNNGTGVLLRNVDGISFTSVGNTYTGNLIDVEPLFGDPFTSVDGTFTCDQDACYE